LTNVTIHDPLPAQTSFVDASSGGELAGNQVQWIVGTLVPGDSRTVEVRLRALAPGRICNQALVTADRGVTRQVEACTDFAGAPALSLEVADTEDPVEVGGQTSYKITVRNPGSNPVTRMQIVATVPEEMIVTRASGTADNHKDGQKIIYDPLTVPAGGEARFRVDVKAQRPGDVRFKVELTADQLTSGPVQQEESTTIFAMLPSSRRKGAWAKVRAASKHADMITTAVPGQQHRGPLEFTESRSVRDAFLQPPRCPEGDHPAPLGLSHVATAARAGHVRRSGRA
jgi:uncharacterized repeat protein (TIGR01451 family)